MGEEKVSRLIVRTPDANSDFNEIWSYIAQDNAAAADETLDRIESQCVRIAAYPESGRDRSDLCPDLRSISVGNYLVFYRVTPNSVEIIRVLHSARDITPKTFSR